MSWLDSISGIFICLLVLLHFPPWEARKHAGCTREELSHVQSPDGAWIAAVYLEICSDGAFTTTATDNVQIASTNDRERKADIFAEDEDGYPEDRPDITWVSSDQLRITVPHWSTIGLHPQPFGPVGVELIIKPDDPAVRTQIFKRLGLPPPDPSFAPP